jgi:hypothetical protein
MKKLTFDKGQQLLENKKSVICDIQQIVDGRGKYYSNANREWELDAPIKLDGITIRCVNKRKNETTDLHFSFDINGSLATNENFKYLSGEKQVLLAFLSNSYRESVCNILLSEEKRIQKEFDDLKDE